MSIYSQSEMLTSQFLWLSAILLLPLVATLALAYIPNKDGKSIFGQAFSAGIPQKAIALSLLLAILGIGLYPRIASPLYNLKITALARENWQGLSFIQPFYSRLYSGNFLTPEIPNSRQSALLDIVENISSST